MAVSVEILIKLVKLANSNSVEAEAISAAKKVCKELEEDNFKILKETTRESWIKAIPSISRREERFNSSAPRYRNTDGDYTETQEGFRRRRREEEEERKWEQRRREPDTSDAYTYSTTSPDKDFFDWFEKNQYNYAHFSGPRTIFYQALRDYMRLRREKKEAEFKDGEHYGIVCQSVPDGMSYVTDTLRLTINRIISPNELIAGNDYRIVLITTWFNYQGYKFNQVFKTDKGVTSVWEKVKSECKV